MYQGWLQFAGNEILNEERTRTYVREQLPGITMPISCAQRENPLHEALGEPAYRNPRLDEAVWLDDDDPASEKFLGAYPLAISGLTDSTRAATVQESVGVGGSVIGLRHGTKEVRVSALLMAVDDAGLYYGKMWLKQALAGGCDPCQPDTLCFLSSVPGPDDVPMGDYVTEDIPLSKLTAPTGRWNLSTRVFSPSATSQHLLSPKGPQPVPCDEVFYHWTLTSTAGTQIKVDILYEGGEAASATFVATGASQRLSIGDRSKAQRMISSRISILTASRTATISGLQIEYRETADPNTCLDLHLRSLRQVTAIDGPRTVREFEPSAGAMEQVEFTFVAGVPWVYRTEEEILSMEGDIPKYTNPYAVVRKLGRTVPVCSSITPVTRRVTDPDCPPVPAPPRAAAPVTGCGPVPDQFDSYALLIPDEAIPTWAETVPILSLTTGAAAARHVRARFVPRPLSTQVLEDLDPCSACGQFVIDYIPPNHTFTLNGMEERAYLTQLAGEKVSDADHLLSGLTPEELFEWPVLTCGTGYYVLLDINTASVASGIRGVSLSVAVRE